MNLWRVIMIHTMNLMFIGPCIIVIVEEWKTNLISLAILFHFLCVQHVSHQSSNTKRTENKTTYVAIHQHSRKLLMMDILMSETCWAHKKWNKIASDINLVFHSSTYHELVTYNHNTYHGLVTYDHDTYHEFVNYDHDTYHELVAYDHDTHHELVAYCHDSYHEHMTCDDDTFHERCPLNFVTYRQATYSNFQWSITSSVVILFLWTFQFLVQPYTNFKRSGIFLLVKPGRIKASFLYIVI